MLKTFLVALTLMVNDKGLYVEVPNTQPVRTKVLMDDSSAELYAESAVLGWESPQCMLAERKAREQLHQIMAEAEKFKPDGEVHLFCRTEGVSRFVP